MSSQELATDSVLTGYETLLAADPVLLDAMPAGVCICAADGVIVRSNRRARELWGRSLKLNHQKNRFCGSLRFRDRDGRPVPHDAGPMAEALRTGEPQRQEVVIERPDGSTVIVLAQVEPLRSPQGEIQGAINCFVNIAGQRAPNKSPARAEPDVDADVESALVAMCVVNKDGVILRTNQAASDLFADLEDGCIGRRLSAFFVDQQGVAAALGGLVQGKTLEAYPARLRAHHGSIRHVLITSSHQDPISKDVRLVVVDVTGRQRVDGTVWGNQGRSFDLLDALPAAIYATDAEGWLTYYNDAACELWGRQPPLGESRWCGAHKLYWADGRFMPHESCPMATALKENLRIRGVEAIAERPDGTRVCFIPHPTPLQDEAGNVIGAINMLVDITERKVAEEIRHRLAAVVQSSDDAIVSKTLDGVIMSWNPAAEKLFGWTAEEACGQSIMLIIPSDRRHEEDMIIERLRHGERVDHYDTVRRRKDGTQVDVSISIAPLKTDDGRIIGASKIARDVSERKRAEQALAWHMDELAAMYQFIDRLHRASALESVYDAALEAIRRALRCDRASILLLDESGTMQFAAWRGLSERYRQAMKGHCPWKGQTAEPRPFCIGNIETGDLEPEFNSIVAAEGIKALAFVPLLLNGVLVGKFMAYYDAPHQFSESEIELAVTLARQLGFGMARLRAEEARRTAEAALRASEARERAHATELQTIMAAVPAVIWIARDLECRMIYGNPFSFKVMQLDQPDQPPPAAGREISGGFQLLAKEGRLPGLDALPIRRAARGDEIRNLEERIQLADGSSRFLLGNATPLRDSQGQLSGAVAAFVDITDRKKAEEQRDLLVAELSHRVKNTLATVISIAQQSFSRNPDQEEARLSFASRIRALAQTHNRLAESSWSGASLEAMLLDELKPYCREDDTNVKIEGEPVMLSSKCAVTLGMTIHELATNAAKHGALSTKSGSVEVTWRRDPSDQKLLISWVEQGGPPVVPPRRSGFGRLLLDRALAADIGGSVDLDFATDGLRCLMAVPLSHHVVQMTSHRVVV